MTITPRTRINELLAKYGFLLDFLVELSPKYKLLRNPLARNTVGNIATLAQVAAIGGFDVRDLVVKIAAKIERETGAAVQVETGSETAVPIAQPAAKHEMLKAIIRGLHEGGDFDDAKRQFAELIRDIDAAEIGAMEQRLIAEGMPESEVKRLCDVHVRVFKESIDVKNAPVVPEGHPIHTLMAENRALERLLTRIDDIVRTLGTPPFPETYGQFDTSLTKVLDSLQKVHLHYLRKENQLFPVLEKHEITGPSQVMWSLDDDIRGMIKKCASLHRAYDMAGLIPALKETTQALRDMIYKEERILFPLALETLTAPEWDLVKRGEEEVGYAWIAPSPGPRGEETARVPGGAIDLDTGTLTQEQINLLLTNLPLDVTFVDENDEVRYYSAGRERIFPRSPGVIGRKVQNCHPPRSMPRVQEILNAFRAGTHSVAEFWITMHGKFIHIRYFAMRDVDGRYRGCLEVVQDATGIRGLQGERRLLG